MLSTLPVVGLKYHHINEVTPHKNRGDLDSTRTYFRNSIYEKIKNNKDIVGGVQYGRILRTYECTAFLLFYLLPKGKEGRGFRLDSRWICTVKPSEDTKHKKKQVVCGELDTTRSAKSGFFPNDNASKGYKKVIIAWIDSIRSARRRQNMKIKWSKISAHPVKSGVPSSSAKQSSLSVCTCVWCTS